MTDLVERLRAIRLRWKLIMESHPAFSDPKLLFGIDEATTAIEAKDKELAALKGALTAVKGLREIAERERDMLGEAIEDTARELGCKNDNEEILIAIDKLRRGRDEAREASADFVKRCQTYLDDAPLDGRHSDAAGSNAYELIEEAIEHCAARAITGEKP